MKNLKIADIVEEILVDIFSINNISGDTWARKPRAGFTGCTLREFITKIIEYEIGEEFIQYENWSGRAFFRATERALVPIFGKIHGGNQTWARVLLQSIEVKKCPHCLSYLRYSDYGIDKHNFASIDSLCKKCKSYKNAAAYDKIYHKQYIEVHRSEYNARNAKYRADRAQRNVSWADFSKIKEIYNNCPEGYHVDHIIPLKGKVVSGLHVENNLQYLTIEENLKKGNKYNEGVEK